MKLFCGRQLLQAVLLEIFPHNKPTQVGKTMKFQMFLEFVLKILEFSENLLEFSEKIMFLGQYFWKILQKLHK